MLDPLPLARVQIVVLAIAAALEKEAAALIERQRNETRRPEHESDLLSRAEDREAVVVSLEKLAYVTETRVTAGHRAVVK